MDFVLPERLDAAYIAKDGKKNRPVMLHRAIFGSFERFIGVLLEHYNGKLPLWLSPVQVVVTTITDEAKDYAMAVVETLSKAKIRVEFDDRNEKISYKIREHSLQKIPYILAIGKKEDQDQTVAVRRFGSPEQTIMTVEDFLRSIEIDAVSPAI